MSAYPATALVGHRLNAFRLNYLGGGIAISIGGVAGQVLIDSMTISDRLDEVPNTLVATVRGVTPVEGQVIRVTMGSTNGALLFAGNILRVTRVWAARNPKYVLHHIEAIDPTWRLQAGLFSARYQNQSASTIAADLLTRAPAGFTPMIEAGLPWLDEISFTNATLVDALVQLARRIGGYTRVDYEGRVYLFTTPDTTTAPAPLTAAHTSLAGVTYQRDLTQVITRAIVEGGGGVALANVPPGATVLPVDPPGWYATGGGFVRSGPQRIAYTGLTAGGQGAYVGAGVTPTTAPAATVAIGSSAVNNGVHGYAYTWVTASGETLPSPVVSVTVGPGGTTPPVARLAGGYKQGSGSQLTIGQYYSYAWAWNYHPTDYSNFTNISGVSAVPLQWLCLGYDPLTGNDGTYPYYSWHTGTYSAPVDTRSTWMCLFRWVANAWRLVGGIRTVNVNKPESGHLVDGFYSDATVAADPVAFPVHPAPVTGTALTSQVTVSAVALGPSGVTARKLYRTAAGASQLKLHSTIADNTTTALASYDNTADAGLGANAPTVDTAGIIQQTKLVVAGSTVLPVTSVGPFVAPGYALVGNQVVSYAGVAAAALTGVPATGDGALVQSVAWGTPITVAPALLGVTGIRYPVQRGDNVNVVAIVDDAPAQTALAARVGGDGVRESLLQDGRISRVEADARGRALLAAQKDVRQTFTHRSRDPNTRSGAVVTVDLPAPTDVHGSFRLQDVTIDTFNARGLVPPTFHASSSSQRFTFEDLLRQMANTTPAPATERIGSMAINRAPFNALVDDDGSNTTGSPWNKAAIQSVLLDPIDVALLEPAGLWTDAPFNAADFWPGVAANHVIVNKWARVNKAFFWIVQMYGAPAPSPAVPNLSFTLPAFSMASLVAAMAWASDVGAGGTVAAYGYNASPTTLAVIKASGGNWTAGGAINIYFNLTVPLL